MSPTNLTQLVLALLCFAVLAGVLGWTRAGAGLWPPVSAIMLAAAAIVAAVSSRLDHGRVALTVLVALAAALAVVGGGPVTTRIFTLVDRSEHARRNDGASLDRAGQVLRGGAWIGALERLAVFASLAAGFAGGVAVVLALKGVGRYPDLRGDRGEPGGASTERFIIGTFASVLWAAACAGVVALVRG